jgi:hypothetical protein
VRKTRRRLETLIEEETEINEKDGDSRYTMERHSRMIDRYSCAVILGPASIGNIMFDRFDSGILPPDSELQKVRVLAELDFGSSSFLSLRNSSIIEKAFC